MNLFLKPNPALASMAGFVALASLKKPYVAGYLKAASRTIPRLATRLDGHDRLGALRVRLDIGRSTYRVMPGLYAVGAPGRDSPVLVSANYKLSFDALRKELEGIDAWILVLDTKGINVWCAAGKGSFGTEELSSRIEQVRLREVAPGATIVLPQLAGPGVRAVEVAKRTGFKVKWGPVLASDIRAFLEAGSKKTEAMRTIRFGFRERILLAPVELVHAWPFLAIAIPLAAAYGLPFDGGWIGRTALALVLAWGGIVMGAAGTPALLPFLPSRSFAIKGAFLGALWGGGFTFLSGMAGPGISGSSSIVAVAGFPGVSLIAGAALLCASVSSWIALNFTGSSTFTCQEGAKLEVERGLWPILVGGIAGLGLISLSRALGI